MKHVGNKYTVPNRIFTQSRSLVAFISIDLSVMGKQKMDL